MNRLFALLVVCTALSVLAVTALLGAVADADRVSREIDARFEVARSGGPSTLWSRPYVVRRGDRPERLDLAGHLVRSGHREVTGEPERPGEFWREPRRWRIWSRSFQTPDGDLPARILELALDGRGGIASISEGAAPDARRRALARLAPLRLAVLAGAEARDREPVALADLPSGLVEAVLVIEDQRFFEHHGLDPTRIAGAAVANLAAGEVVQGGSTITQQLVKNLFLDSERSLARKLREAWLALSLETRRSKSEILEAYLNEAYLGQDGALAIHGVAAAARHYFGRPVAELEVDEAALLAGLLRGPSLYSPWRRPEAARARRDFVIARLAEAGHLDAEAAAAARARPLGVVKRAPQLRSTDWFVEAMAGELGAWADAEGVALARARLAFHASLDPRLQGLAQSAIERGVAGLEARYPKLLREDSPLQAALVALDPRSGEVLAQVGGRDYARSQFDRSTQAWRQPGSVFKPVVALSALARQGRLTPPFTLASVLIDEPISLLAEEGAWQPANHDGRHRGEVTLRETLEQSLNVPMAQLGAELGLRRVIGTARRLGLRSRMRAVPSLPLGTFETTLLEITGAYGVLASGGLRTESHRLRAVGDADGATRWRAKPERHRAFREAETYLVTSALEGVVDRGTGASLRRLGFHGPMAGKTGTTDDYRDGWFIGYTPDLVVGVWVGFDDGASLPGSGSRTALPIFADFVVAALGPRGGRRFPRPAGIESVEVVAQLGHPAGLRCAGAFEVFLEGSGPAFDERCGLPGWLARRFGWGDEGDDDGRVGRRGRRMLPPGLRLRFGRAGTPAPGR